MIDSKTKQHPYGQTVASVWKSDIPGLYKVVVCHKFDSGNYIVEPDKDNLSLVAAQGLLEYYTS
jgi:hypothetical protein